MSSNKILKRIIFKSRYSFNFSEIKDNNTLNEKLNKFFNTTNIDTNIIINE